MRPDQIRHYDAQSPTQDDLSKARARIFRLEAALSRIEHLAESAIHKGGITQPASWFDVGTAILDTCAPIRDEARKALK